VGAGGGVAVNKAAAVAGAGNVAVALHASTIGVADAPAAGGSLMIGLLAGDSSITGVGGGGRLTSAPPPQATWPIKMRRIRRTLKSLYILLPKLSTRMSTRFA
jgi:hypothetical protein